MALPATMSRSSFALHNLRAVVILIVLAFHAVLAYVQFIPEHAGAFNKPPYMWRSFPIADSQSLVRLRSVLRLAGYLPDGADVPAVRPVRLVEPAAQAELRFHPRSVAPPRHSVCVRRAGAQSDRLLSGLSQLGRRPERGRLSARIYCFAVPAQRAALVLVAASGAQFRAGGGST